MEPVLLAMSFGDVAEMIRTEVADKALYEPLVRPAVLVGSGILYVAAALLLRFLMREQQPFSLKQTMRLYNVVQVAVCGYMTYGTTSPSPIVACTLAQP
jgi:hypothetical protein